MLELVVHAEIKYAYSVTIESILYFKKKRKLTFPQSPVLLVQSDCKERVVLVTIPSKWLNTAF